MTIQDLINVFNNYPNYILTYFGAILTLSFIVNTIVRSSNINTIKYVMSLIVYAVVVPGMLALFLVLYNILFLKSNILQISILSYFLPIVTMILTLVVISKKVQMSRLPGFNKLSSLFMMISIAFGLIFVLQRTYFGVLILGSFTHVLIVFAVLMIVLRFAWARFTK